MSKTANNFRVGSGSGVKTAVIKIPSRENGERKVLSIVPQQRRPNTQYILSFKTYN